MKDFMMKKLNPRVLPGARGLDDGRVKINATWVRVGHGRDLVLQLLYRAVIESELETYLILIAVIKAKNGEIDQIGLQVAAGGQGSRAPGYSTGRDTEFGMGEMLNVTEVTSETLCPVN